MAETNIIVARARIAGGIALTEEAPAHARADAGSPIRIKFPFRFEDLSKLREDYTVELRVQIDDEPEETSTLEGKDHPVLSDDKRGFVVQERTIIAPGEHVLRFRAAVRLEIGGWDGGDTQLQEQALEGRIQLTVR